METEMKINYNHVNDYHFDVEVETARIITWIQNWFFHNGRGCNCIIGISGGKDSSVVAALCAEALGKERVLGVMMPNGEQNDLEYSYLLCRTLGIKHVLINIEDAVNGVTGAIKDGVNINKSRARMMGITDYFGFDISEQAKINLPARIRMATLYAVSQCNNGRVANTCNLSEDYVGYATRYGDGAGDFAPLANYTTEEVMAIGEYLGLPEDLIYKVPSDGLCGKTDEESLGFTYAELNEYIRTGNIENPTHKLIIDTMHDKNIFKIFPMQTCTTDLVIANAEIFD